MEYAGLAVRLKKLMNDIIDVAYQDESEYTRRGLKGFSIECYSQEPTSFLGFYEQDRDKNTVRLYYLKEESFKSVLIIAMHEVSHHIEVYFTGDTGHQKPFYDIHKKLLFAAMDMGILTKDDVVNSDCNARNRDKLARMMKDYIPHPKEYKKGRSQISVYDAYAFKDILKERGYKWNSLDRAWEIEVDSADADEEVEVLSGLGVQRDNIKITDGAAVFSRLRKIVRLYRVPYESKEIVKALGYRWVNEKTSRYWEKSIDGDDITEEERSVLESIYGIAIHVSK